MKNAIGKLKSLLNRKIELKLIKMQIFKKKKLKKKSFRSSILQFQSACLKKNFPTTLIELYYHLQFILNII